MKILLKITAILFSLTVLTELPLFAENSVGVRPYEMDWANRTQDDNSPLIDFEQFGKWTVDAVDSTASFVQSREQQIFGKYTAKLTYRGQADSKNPSVTVRPEKALPVPADHFDAMSCWIYGNNWAWVQDDSTPRVTVSFLFKTPNGSELSFPITYVCWREWFLCHYRFTEEQQKQLNRKGCVFTGIKITGGKNIKDRSIWFDNIALFKEKFKPLEFSKRPQRGIAMFPGQDCGQNTGSGRLPFPTREETILPINKDPDAKTSAAKTDHAFQFIYSGSDGKMTVIYEPKTGTWSDLRLKWNQSGWFSPAAEGGVNFLVNNKGENEPVEKRIIKLAKLNGSKLKTCWTLKSKTVSADVEYHFQLMNKTIVVDTFVKGGHVPEIAFGKLSGYTESKTFKVPYYSYGGANRPYAAVLKIAGSDQSLFVMTHMDWYRSNASSVSGLVNSRVPDLINDKMIYNPKTNGLRNDVYERFFIAVSPDFEEVLPEIPNPISPWKHITGKKVWRAHGASADRQNDYNFWFDIWRHGIREVVVTDHEVGWRDGGESFTFRVNAAPKKGGDKGMFDYARYMQDDLKFTYGPYNNFTDFAPVNGYWSYDMISRTKENQLQRAWARCYAPKPARAVEYCEKLTPIIQNKFRFSTAYCDVHTSVTPWSRTDYDARVPGAGTFAAVFYPYGEIMLLQKKNWKGPVYSEGPHHCFYSGLTDGNYAQDRGYYIPGEPWLLDFDLRKIHDHECNFGIGAPDMYDPKISDHRPKTSQEIHNFLDRYFAAMIAFGHPGFLTSNFGIEGAMKSYFMVQPIASCYTQVPADKIWYLDQNGKKYDISQALTGNVFAQNRHLVTYKDGTYTAVNANTADYTSIELDQEIELENKYGNLVKTKKIELPPNGYFCRSGDGKVLVLSLEGNGSKFDYSVGPEGVYLNARGKFHRCSLAAGSSDGVCRFLKDGKYEVIVTNNKEIGFKVDADTAVALSYKDQKDLGPAVIRKSRGYVYIQPVQGAFSYRLEKKGKSAVANASESDVELMSDRFYAAPGEKVTAYAKSDPSRKFEIEIPSNAKPGLNLWFEPVKGSWINFVTIEPVEISAALQEERYLTVTANAKIDLLEPLAVSVSFDGKDLKPVKIEIKEKKSILAVFDLPKPSAVKQEKAIVTAVSGKFKQSFSVTFDVKKDYINSNFDLISEDGLIPSVWLECRGAKRQTETEGTGAGAYRQKMNCGGVEKNGWFMHPPYMKGTGRIYLEYNFDVPNFKESMPVLRASVGKRDGSDSGDGIRFQIAAVADGKEIKLAEQDLIEHKWVPIEADLTAYAGKTITLRLISDVGPKNNSAGDWSCWADLRVTSADQKLIRTLSDK